MTSSILLTYDGLADEGVTKYTVGPMLLPEGNPNKCHEEVLSLQLMIPTKRFDILST